MNPILRRTITGLGLVIVFAGSILLGPTLLLAVILATYVLGIRELFKLLSLKGFRPCGLLAMAGASFILFSYAGLRWNASPLWFLLTAGFFTGGLLRLRSAYAASLYFFWLAVPLASFIALGWAHSGEGYRALLPLSAIILVWINDIFAYLSGTLLGRHPLTPRLSPGKTWEGLAGGFLFNLIGGYGFYLLAGMYPAWVWILSGGLISLLSFSGDLFESGLKRSFGVKDTGNLLPGHGGILDRFDSLLFVAPVLWFVLTIVNHFG